MAVASLLPPLYNPPRPKVGRLNFERLPLLNLRPDDNVSQPRPLVDTYPAKALLVAQGIVALLLLTIALPFGRLPVLSVALGTSIALVGTAYFAFHAFRYAGAQHAQMIVRSFYRGEAGKFMLTALLFSVVLVAIKPLHYGWLLTGFILEQFVAWLMPLWLARHR